ncbi:hypothetical protein L208DRAFT_1271098 [Tricholoma matsutake]|nr:hypothetical protein L208DRAFT_1271098 [Tricholoma matsutake 945]
MHQLHDHGVNLNTVCGQLTPQTELTKLKTLTNQLHVLHAEGVTRKERKKISEKIEDLTGPILASNCDQVCNLCQKVIHSGKTPHRALVNSLWPGEVPEELQDLRNIEKLLIQKVCINGCFIRVTSSKLCKMVSNAVAFESPVAKVYNILPPPIEDLDEVLAVLFTGPCKPSREEFQ